VFIPKYRSKTMYGQVKRDVHEILKTLCEYKKVEILSGAVCKDHVHLCLSIPPKLSVSDFMGYLKGYMEAVVRKGINEWCKPQPVNLSLTNSTRFCQNDQRCPRNVADVDRGSILHDSAN